MSAGLSLSQAAIDAAEELLDSADSNYPQRATRRRDAMVIKSLEIIDPGRRFSALVVDGRTPCQLTIVFDHLNLWRSTCSCPQERDCIHLLAVLDHLLDAHDDEDLDDIIIADHPALKVLPFTSRAQTPSNVPQRGTFARQAAVILKRKLTSQESRIATDLENMHVSLHLNYGVSLSRLVPLGVNVASASLESWTDLRVLAPLDASDTLAWWGNLAFVLSQHKATLPPLLAALTNHAAAAARMQQWQRNQAIQVWHRTIDKSLQTATPIIRTPSLPLTDLRLRLASTTLQLEGLVTDATEYQPLPTKLLRRLEEEGPPLSWPAEAMAIWSAYSLHVLAHFPQNPTIPLDAHGAGQFLAALIHHPALTTRTVGANGQPLDRPADPLRWDLQPADTPDGNYSLKLVTSDGTPVTNIIATLHTQPTRYLTTTAIYTGPDFSISLPPFAQLQTIPAPALESIAGARWLDALQVPLPPRLAARVQHLPVHVAIRCALDSSSRPGSSEQCLISLSAASDNAYVDEVWYGPNAGWHARNQSRQNTLLSREDPTGTITLYNRTAQTAAAAFVTELNARWSQEHRELSLRVTKKFPDQFAAWLRRTPPNVQVHLDGDLASLAQAEVVGHVRLDVTENGVDWFDLRVAVNVHDTTLSPEEVKLLLAAHGGYVRLTGKGWRRLSFDLSAEEQEALARLGLNPRDLDAEPQRLHALQLADAAARRMLPEAQAGRVERRADEIRLRASPTIPAGIAAELRPYQVEGFHFLAYLSTNRFGGILADDMGLGKTLQALTWLVWLRSEAGETPGAVLIVCPKSVTDNWHAEAARFAPGLRVRVWHGNEAVSALAAPASADVHVINYNQLRLAEDAACKLEWLAVVLDEGQYIKNPASQVAQIARRLRAHHRLVLTGTPIENQLLDLWSLLAFAMPGALGTRAQFGRTFDVKGDPLSRRRLAARVRPFLLRRTKGQVASDLPARVEEDLFCEMEGHQLSLYRAELKRARQLVLGLESDAQLAQQRFNILVSLLRLRQICCHPALVDPTASADESAKLDALLELLGPLMEEEHKVLVFSQFVEVLQLVRQALVARDWPHFLLTGATENRGDLVAKFKAATGAAVFLISLRAGGFGLNLADASYVVLFDPWWNPAVENQAIDRTHRIGQTRTVNAYRLLVKGTIEEKIRLLQRQKSGLADDVLGEERFAQALTLHDLRFLFEDTPEIHAS